MMATANTQTRSYEYDVAFSFLKEDEDQATKLNDLLQERLSTFLYSKRQKEIAGTDGEITFNNVFGGEARIVVVLYRDHWGTTSWTRIEQTAIRNRGYEEGYDFVIFIPLEKNSTLPQWLPKTQIWVGLERLGLEGAAIVIDARVQQSGGSPREETFEDRAARLKRELEFEESRKHFLASVEGVQEAHNEVQTLYQIIEDKIAILQNNHGFEINIQRVDRGLDACYEKFCLSVDWRNQYANSLQDSSLVLGLWEGYPPRPGRVLFDKPKHLIEDIYPHFSFYH